MPYVFCGPAASASPIDMTMRYAHLSPDVKRDAVHVLDTPSPARGTYGSHEA